MSTLFSPLPYSDEAGPSSSASQYASGSSPSRIGGRVAAIGGESNLGRNGVAPLRAAKTVALSRRGVFFSPRNDTKYFNSDDSILPSQIKDVPPPSIRSYADTENDIIPYSSSPGPRSETPLSVRGILKQRVHQILLAASVEEGTLSNKEDARLRVSGKRPRLMARDSFQLAVLRKAASDGLSGEGVDKGKGKEKMVEDLPASDDSVSSEAEEVPEQPELKDGSSEVDEEVEEDGALSTASLVNIILDGAEDLLTLEEAYSTLAIRLRQRIPTDVPAGTITPEMESDIQLSITPIRDEAPAMVRAMLRDLQRLLGKVPNSDVPSSEADSSPFRGLMPLRDSTPTNRRLTPSPTPVPQPNKRYSPDGKMIRQGYTEHEVKYRREASGVGAAVMRFLAFTLHTPQLSGCFSDADITSLLDQILVVPRTPRLPTPNPKRSYYLSIVIIAQMKISAACVAPVRDKVARAVESALTDNLGGPPSQSGKDSTGQVKKEAYQAVINLFTTYPSIFFQHYTDLLAPCLRGLSAASPIMRNKAASAIASLATTKLNLLADVSCRETWIRHKSTAHRLEHFVVSHLKSPVKVPGKSGPVYGATGEKKTEWHELEKIFKETVGNANEVHWACATWAIVVTLMGSAYASSGLASSFDHIMDRSMQPSTNSVRPLLARVAWSHAIHAYLTSGMVSSVSDDGKAVISYKPFAGTATGDYSERLKNIQLPVELAFGLALDSSSVSRQEDNARWKWHRAEKAKKFDWMVTCGLASASVVYAYTGAALYHQDQPAKEMTAISGLPSSDGAPVPDSDREENKLKRLERAWEKVVKPLVKSLGNVCAIDRLKLQGWHILDSITRVEAIGSVRPAAWTLDRLLSARYLAGEAFDVDKEFSMETFMMQLDEDVIQASHIPAWGATWSARRFEELLDVFEDTLTGIVGWSESQPLKWVEDHHKMRLIPMDVSRIWSNLLQVLVSIRDSDSSTYLRGLSLITRHLLQIFNRDPTSYVPIGALNLDGTLATDSDALRLNLFGHLFHLTCSILGWDAVGATRIPQSPEPDAVEKIITHTAFGSDGAQQSTMAGSLLGQLLRTTVLSVPLSEKGLDAFRLVSRRVLDAGSIQGFSGKLLGDMTNHMPWIFQDQEDLQLAVWRLLALKWVEVIDLQPSTTSSSTNHTGALLVSLLSCPFRASQVTSSWHQRANIDDLAAWQALLKVTVLRFRAKRVGANLGVLEALAGHLSDFLEQGEKTSSTTITLSCLASATSFISFVTPEAHHASHFEMNENFVPTEFLTLVSKALVESYPHPDSGSSPQEEEVNLDIAISPAVAVLVGNLKEIVRELKGEFVSEVITAVKGGLVVWLGDEARVADDELASILDSVYVTLLESLTGALKSGHISVTAATLDDLIEIFAPRLSVARTPAVPQAFQRFYQQSFSAITADQMSEEVRLFLQDVLAAVPGMLTVPGLAVLEPISEEESQAKYPHAQELASQPAPSAVILVDATVVDIDIDVDLSPTGTPDPTGEYDADVSQSSTQRAKEAEQVVRANLSPIPSIPSEEQPTSLEVEIGGDVFGPTGATIKSKKTKAKSKKRNSKTRPLGEAGSMPEAKRPKTSALDPDSSHSLPSFETKPLVPATSSSATGGDQDDDCIFVRDSPVVVNRLSVQVPATTEIQERQRPGPIASSSSVEGHPRLSILSSAKGWLARVPSFGLFSPTNILDSEPRRPADQQSEKQHLLPEQESVDDVESVDEFEIMEIDPIPPSPQKREVRKGRKSKSRSSTSSSSQSNKSSDQSLSQSHSPIRTRTRSKAVLDVRDQTPADSGIRRGKRGKLERKSSGANPAAAIPIEDDDNEDDELLLSPESARRRRSEEEGSIAAAIAKSSTPPKMKRTRSKSGAVSQEVKAESQESGRFDDATEESLTDPAPAEELPTPARRTAQQARVLAMIQQATTLRAAVESLDLDGVVDLLRNVDSLRAAAQSNLEKRAEEQRAAKRARRG